jgi:formate hydrogenlyase subunit 3/multisubunit Na+/H+ antiporter MnhD subunit
LPILFFMNLVGLLSADNASLLFFESSKTFSFGFSIDKMALIFLFLLNLIWVVFSFYSDRFFSLSES